MAPLGDESLLSYRVVHHAKDHLASPFERYGDGEDGQAVNVVRGAVEGIDYPTHVLLAGERATLLSEHAVRWVRPEQRLHDDLFGSLVHLRGEVHLALVPYPTAPADTVAQHLAGRLRRHQRRF